MIHKPRGSPPDPARPSTEAIAVVTLYRAQSASLRSACARDGRCLVCCRARASHRITNTYAMCTDCASAVLIHLLLPHRLQYADAAEDDAVVERIAHVEAAEKSGEGRNGNDKMQSPAGAGACSSGTLSPQQPRSPLAPPTAPRAAASDCWTCPRCTLTNDGYASACVTCATPRPLLPCPRCALDCTVYATCLATNGEHVLWRCSHCSSPNLEDNRECEFCHFGRPWYCGHCSLENDAAVDACGACGHRERLDDLKSFHRRQELQMMGLNVEEADMERQTSSIAAQASERLRARLARAGLAEVPVSDDGNCLFRALAFQLVRDDGIHGLVRHMIVEHMRCHSDDYGLFMERDALEQYLSEMAMDKTWGDEPCIVAASRVFGASIHLVTSDSDRWHRCYKPPVVADGAAGSPGRRPRLFLAYLSGLHYFTFTLQRSGAVAAKPPPPPPPFDLESACAQLAPAVAPARSSAAEAPQPPKQQTVRWLSSAAISRLREPIVVRLQVDGDGRNLSFQREECPRSSTRSMIGIWGQCATQLYLHPAGVIRRRDHHGVTCPYFFLQEVCSGLFVHGPATSQGGGTREELRCRPLPSDAEARRQFALVVEDESRIVFPHGGRCCIGARGRDMGAPAVVTPMEAQALPILVMQLLPEGERRCVTCGIWYNVAATRPATRSSGPCAHVNVADGLSLSSKR